MRLSSLLVLMPSGRGRCGRAVERSRPKRDPFFDPVRTLIDSQRASRQRRTTMATVMVMHWPGITTEHYEALRRESNFEGVAPKGGKYHVAWPTKDGLHVVDVWDSQAAFEQFMQ